MSWLPVTRQVGLLTNQWSQREDIVAYVGEDTHESCLACFDSASSEVQLNSRIFTSDRPEDIDLTSRKSQYEYHLPVGLIFHEAMHAKHTKWNSDVMGHLTPSEVRTLTVLEEARIEKRGLDAHPRMRPFLKGTALNLCIKEMTNASVTSNARSAANAHALVYSRVDAGIVSSSDVVDILEMIDKTLGEEASSLLREIETKFRDHNDDCDFEYFTSLCKEWNAVVDSLQEEPPPDSDPWAEGGSDILGAMISLEDDVVLSAVMDMIAQDKSETDAEILEEISKKSRETTNSKRAYQKVFGKVHEETPSGKTKSRLVLSRPPTGQEMSLANSLALSLERVKYRDRDVSDYLSIVPPGRLRGSAMVEHAAATAAGRVSRTPLWKSKKRQRTDEPTLHVGIAVDISGSMSSAMEDLARVSYIVGEAVYRIQGKVSTVYFGNSCFPTLREGQRPKTVDVWSAPDMSEDFDTAFLSLNESVRLLDGDGARLLIVVSDGHYQSEQREICVRWMSRCFESGVSVVWVPFHNISMYAPAARASWDRYISESSAEVVPHGKDIDVVKELSKACVDALSKTAATV